MTAETFAQNLRAEMGRQGLPLGQFALNEFYERASTMAAFGTDCPKVAEIYFWRWRRADRAPTEKEVAAIAAALGCPIERLTVSRLQLEQRLMTREDELDGMASLLRDAKARIAELEAEVQEEGMEACRYEKALMQISGICDNLDLYSGDRLVEQIAIIVSAVLAPESEAAVMSPADLAAVREQARLANLTPGDAAREDLYEEHLAAVKAAPALAMALLDHAHEADRAREYATGRCSDWFALAQTLRLENEVLWTRVHAAEGRHRQNERIRKMWLEERGKQSRRKRGDMRLATLCDELRQFSQYCYQMADRGDISQRLLMLSMSARPAAKPTTEAHV